MMDFATGSGKAAICRSPAAILAIVRSVSLRRSINAVDNPSSRARAQSYAFALCKASDSRSSAPAIHSSASFLAAVGARAMTRAARALTEMGDEVIQVHQWLECAWRFLKYNKALERVILWHTLLSIRLNSW